MHEMPTVAGQVEQPERLATQEVTYPSEGAKIPSYLARPRESGRYRGIVILHDIFGVSDHARDVARRFANVGFVVLCPIVSRVSKSAPMKRSTKSASLRVSSKIAGP